MKQSCNVDSTMKVEYVVTSKIANEAIRLQKFLLELKVMALVVSPLILFCDNSGIYSGIV